MKFKEPELEAEFALVSQVLKEIVGDFVDISEKKMGVECVMTRVLEPVPGESGVHEDKRAVDFRDESDGHFLYRPEDAKLLEVTINAKWKRNDGKPTCLHHSFQGGPFHFHLQIPYLTKVYEQ